MAKKKVVSKTSTTKPAPKKKAPRKKKVVRREEVANAPQDSVEDDSSELTYPEPKVEIAKLTADKAKELIGWHVESENVKFKDKYDFSYKGQDDKTVKVRLIHNVRNRPLTMSAVERLRQEVLRKRWRFNGEPVIIGQTGLLLNGQHTLVALILAFQEWETHRGKWKDTWDGDEPFIDKLVVFGVSEDDDVVNTMDTCKPRTLADVFYRSETFIDIDRNARKRVTRMADYAVRLLWQRVGQNSDSHAPYRTHSEALDFLARHPKLVDCVSHIYEENGTDNLIGKFISPGTAAGLLYLMAACKTDEDTTEYSTSDMPHESMLDMSAYETACEFWVLFAAGDKKLSVLRQALAATIGEEGDSPAARIAIVIKAWSLFLRDKPLKTDALALSYTHDEDGIPELTDAPSISGIDLGPPAR